MPGRLQRAMPIPRSKPPLSLVVGGAPRDASNSDLAAGLVAGEEWAVSETWRRFSPMVLMTGQRILGSKSEAEDLAQEVFCQVFQRVKTLRQFDSFRSFVYSFAVRLLRAELRRRKRRQWLSFFGGDPPETLISTRPISSRGRCSGDSTGCSTGWRRATGWCSSCDAWTT